jgi:hypothetical protein
MSRSSRRRASTEAPGTVDGAEVDRRNAAAVRAYWLCMLGLIPGVGLVLGPVSLVLAAVARFRGSKVPGFSHEALATAIVMLAALITATQWAGAALMLFGLSGRP